MYNNKAVAQWVDEMAKLTKPDNIVWLDGSEEEKERLSKQAFATGELVELNQEKLPGCCLHRTAVNDVARVEDRTFICTRNKDDAGPTNNWMDPAATYEKLGKLFDGSMKGRTMYVVPYVMGPVGSPFSKVGVELTDSIYVVLNMRIMTRMGKVAMDQLGDSSDFVKCLHSKATLDPNERYICHFPEDNTIWSVNSGYGGNVILSKKCFALRIASFMGRQQGWMAEHMLIVGIEDPEGHVDYIAGAFPSACGKTNLAMLVPPEVFKKKGYKVWTVGDDIAWLRIGPDGRLWAVNPEAGFFGVAPGTNYKSNPNAMETVKKNTIFTNVVLTPEGTVWWEGMGEPPKSGIDWKGNPWTPESGEKGAHPNSRFTAPASQCPSISPEWENPQGVPLTAIIFGGRRARVAPLVYQSFDWNHGVYVGATMASETTAAAAGQVGVVRRDPMAMLPFCGYNMADYFAYWLEMGKRIPNPPKIFNVNWFRTDDEGNFIWPGFGENLRALLWIIERCKGEGKAVETPIGYVPEEDAIDLEGLDISPDVMKELLKIDKDVWADEVKSQSEFLEKFGDRLPEEMRKQNEALKKRFGF
ncbi:phosphoenolpyruvate carboxykinase (GTP) [Mahella sp.]|uniref:phosphoenolpyruvate carboxykinase (GTP) n=1 Tax=Mahella sp. TaxID=2798721 RepID=UPI0025C63F5C|nr:phosphoenolpyruvate carboxykinase (GTP) [Mahella sp.]MBZ4665793.1 Phosphoenolpyruvate carboxykinase [Mahella sp.]